MSQASLRVSGGIVPVPDRRVTGSPNSDKSKIRSDVTLFVIRLSLVSQRIDHTMHQGSDHSSRFAMSHTPEPPDPGTLRPSISDLPTHAPSGELFTPIPVEQLKIPG